MSGGHFDYQQHRIRDISDEITSLIESNDDQTLSEWGYPVGRGYADNTITKFREATILLRLAGIYAQRIDWLVSCDDGEEMFHERLADDLKQLAKDVRIDENEFLDAVNLITTRITGVKVRC